MNEQNLEYERLVRVLKKGKYCMLSDGSVVDDANGRMVCGRLNPQGVVEISYDSTPSIYLGRQIRLYRLLSSCSLPVEAHGVDVATEGLRRQRCTIGNLLARLSELSVGMESVPAK